LGETKVLHDNRVSVTCVEVLIGVSGVGFIDLIKHPSVVHYLSSRASVKITSAPITVEIIAPASSDKGAQLSVGIIPSGQGTPTLHHQILQIPGSVVLQHSTFTGVKPSVVVPAAEVTYQLKPKPYFGYTPVVVYHFDTLGADTQTECHLRVHFQLEVDGVGFHKSW